ncbi:DUF2726 domain-containing protein [Paraneptunicella aestuarii]|uniref:DUF2726 domain-containing protein n=1 Tax=Paraneptunicella aestuarii TaxID=2831148 RepID=UPI001E33A674|nr:DUF2726 domain-containing protein [Paraneptunicella aestuarii]UAA39391.1 DUF2726 domain-containing protein [Paraneptunicella aestuarii]
MELVIVLLILLIAVSVMALKLNDGGLAFPFKKRSNLFTPVERNFLDLLETAVGHQYRIICRVRLTDILDVRKNTAKRTLRTAMQRASGRHLDFVLCDKQDLTPVVAVDLVHDRGDGYKTQRDWFVAGALDAARIPHLRIKVKAGYKPQDIRACIEAKLAPVRFKEPKKPIIEGTNNPNKKPTLTRPIAA